MTQKKWSVIGKQSLPLRGKKIIDILLKNRDLKTTKEKQEFFEPKKPSELSFSELGISELEVKKAIKRLEVAKKNNEKIIVYGDYDADGICATAILWETLFALKFNIMPYIPDRFSEGYGLNAKSVEKLDVKLIITVDNGIVANKEVEKLKKLGVDVIVTDHHEIGKEKPKAVAVIHTQKICGSALSWIFAREMGGNSGLELAGIGTIADQMPLTYANRSFAKWGLVELNKTRRVGLLELFKESGLRAGEIDMYGINYVIAPRINSMGRLAHGIESLRLLCVKSGERAAGSAKLIAKTNLDRQKIVDDVVKNARSRAKEFTSGIIFLAHEKYHEGVIGLAAGRLVEEFYRPAIVVSKGKKFSKGSARSVHGFNIIEAIRKHEKMLVAGGGHPMAAGFTIETTKLEAFQRKVNKTAVELLTEEMLTRKLRIDCEIPFEVINWELVKQVKKFEPTGLGNPAPTFVSYEVEVIEVRILGKEKKHLKLKLKQGIKFFDAIGFGMAQSNSVKKGDKIDAVYTIDENVWNGTRSIQLKLRDLKAKD